MPKLLGRRDTHDLIGCVFEDNTNHILGVFPAILASLRLGRAFHVVGSHQESTMIDKISSDYGISIFLSSRSLGVSQSDIPDLY